MTVFFRNPYAIRDTGLKIFSTRKLLLKFFNLKTCLEGEKFEINITPKPRNMYLH